MGRHRRSAAGRAATGRATTGVTQHDDLYDGGHSLLGAHAEDAPTMGIAPYLNPEAYAETSARSEAYLFATEDAPGGGYAGHFTQGGFYGNPHHETGHQDDGSAAGPSRPRSAETAAADTAVFASDGFGRGDVPRQGGSPDDGFTPGESDRHSGGRRRKKKAATPVRTGLLGVSAAVALGTVAVATGAVPGLENYKLGGERAPATVSRPRAFRPTRPANWAAPRAVSRARFATPATPRAVTPTAPPRPSPRRRTRPTGRRRRRRRRRLPPRPRPKRRRRSRRRHRARRCRRRRRLRSASPPRNRRRRRPAAR